MESIKNKDWWKAAITRAVKTMCQTAVALIGSGAVGVLEVDWVNVASVSAMAGIISLLTSLAGLPEVDYTETLNEEEILEAD